jgi:hypothetical protein
MPLSIYARQCRSMDVFCSRPERATNILHTIKKNKNENTQKQKKLLKAWTDLVSQRNELIPISSYISV